MDNKLAKSIECSYNVETSSISADDKVVHTISTMAEGEGTLEVLGLTGAEKRALFGGENEVGFGLGVDMKQPQMALMFEQKKADGAKMLYVIYDVKFNPAGLSATSVEGGVEEQTISLDFQSIANEAGFFYFCVDTAEAGAETLAQQWYTQVQQVI